jgi:hypothetical protein
MIVSVLVSEPEMSPPSVSGVPPFRQWYESGASPDAPTEKVAVPPPGTEAGLGGLVMDGPIPTVRFAGELVAEPQEFVRTQS